MNLTEAIMRLIFPWTLTIDVDGEQRQQQFEPLIDMLAAGAPGMENTGGGTLPSMRSAIDMKSLDLMIHIEDVVRGWVLSWQTPTSGNLKHDLALFWRLLHEQHQAGIIDQDTYERLHAYPDTWAERIWDLREPPKLVALRAADCPECGHGKLVTPDGDLTDPLLITIRLGREPVAECRHCGYVWVSRDGLVTLGRALGCEIDVETLTEALHIRPENE